MATPVTTVSIYAYLPMRKMFGGETTREEMVLGRNDWGMWGETTRVENRGETTRGETTSGETSCYHKTDPEMKLFLKETVTTSCEIEMISNISKLC